MALLLPTLQNIDLLTVGIAVAGMAILGFAVLFNNFKSISNKLFFFLALTSSIWGITNYLSYQPYPVGIAFWLLKFVMFFAVWSSFFTFTFSFVFPSETLRLSSVKKWGVLFLAVVTSILTLTPFVFSEVAELSLEGRIFKVVNGPGIFVFGLVTAFFNMGAVLVLIVKSIKATDAQKKPIQTVLIGIILMLFLIIVFNFLLPAFFNNSSFIPLGALFLLPFVAFSYYAIMKHKLFNMRIMGTVVLVFALSVLTFSEVILASELTLILYRTMVFVLVLVFGISLIREVRREVEQREKLEVLTKELASANEKLKELDRLKSEFLSFASHQIKAPLAAIKGFATLIYDGTYGEPTEKISGAARKIR